MPQEVLLIYIANLFYLIKEFSVSRANLVDCYYFIYLFSMDIWYYIKFKKNLIPHLPVKQLYEWDEVI